MATYIGTLDSPKESKSGVLKSQCDGCQEAAGISYCSECLQAYCKTCAKAHRNGPATKEHNLLSWEDSSTLVDVLRKNFLQLVQKDKRIKELEEENTSKEEAAIEIETLRTEMKRSGDELMKVRAQLAERERTTNDLQEQNKALTIMIDQNQTDMKRSEDELMKVRGQLAEKEMTTNELQKENKAKEEKIKALTIMIDQNQKEMECNSSKTESLLTEKENNIARLEKEITEYDRKVKLLTEEVKNIKTQIECAEGDLKKEKALLAAKENIIEQLLDVTKTKRQNEVQEKEKFDQLRKIANDQYFLIILETYEEDIGTNLKRKIVSALKDITSDVGVYVPIYCHEIGLKTFGINIPVGLVRISGGKLNEMDIITKVKSKSVDLLTLPEDVFGTTQVLVKAENTREKPSIKVEMRRLCETLGIKMAFFEEKLWFVGESVPVAVARCHLNNLHQKEFDKKLIIRPNTEDNPKLPEILYDHPEKEFTAGETFPTAFLFLYFITSDTKVKDVEMSAVVAEKCWDTRLLLNGKRGSFYGKGPVDKALDHIKDKIDHLQKTHSAIYITDHLPTGYRTMMEKILEQVHKPTLCLKSNWSHWSCYLYPTAKAKAAQQFLDEYREVNSVTSTETSQ